MHRITARGIASVHSVVTNQTAVVSTTIYPRPLPLLPCRHCASESAWGFIHRKAKDLSSMRSLENLSMDQQTQGVSDGMYIYRHRCKGGADIHDIFLKKSTFRVLLSCVGAILLLANVCCTLLSKESLYLGSLWSISFAGIIAKYLRYDPVKKESVVIMPTFGVQLEQHFWSGRVYRKFVPIGKILKPVLNEHVTPVTCYWSLKLLLRDEYELMVVFKRLRPPAKILVPIWKALFGFTNSDGTSTSDVCRPFVSHGFVEQEGGVLPESSSKM